MDSSLFFPEVGRNRATPRISQEARDACAKCPVVEPCREWAIHHELYGFQGGLTEKERGVIRRDKRIIIWQPEHTNPSERRGTKSAPLESIQHGSSAGYRAERRRGLTPCDACLTAHRRKGAEAKARRQGQTIVEQ